MNNKGVTLLELLVCLVILGIIIPIMGQLFVGMNRTIVRAQKATQLALAANNNIKFANTTTNTVGTVVVCFDNGKAIGCDEQHPCYFDNQWKRNNGTCSDGVLLK